MWVPTCAMRPLLLLTFFAGGFIELLTGLENWLVDRLKSYFQLLLVEGCDKFIPHWDLHCCPQDGLDFTPDNKQTRVSLGPMRTRGKIVSSRKSHHNLVIHFKAA